MKKLLLFAALFAMAACSPEEGPGNDPNDGNGNSNAPTITEVRDINGRALTYIGRNVDVTIVGTNLYNVSKVEFNGMETDMDFATFTPTRIIISVPGDAPTAAEGIALADEAVKVTNPDGSATKALILLPPPPSLSSMSNYTPAVGSSLTITGENLFHVRSVSFPTATTPVVVTEGISANAVGTEVTVTVPSGFDADNGNIVVTCISGTASIMPGTPPEQGAPIAITRLKYEMDPTEFNPVPQNPVLKSNLQVGDLVFVDRTAPKIVYMPNAYKGAQWISTATDSRKFVSETPLMSFEISRKADIYIAYCRGTQTYASWLAEWTLVEPGENNENTIEVFAGESFPTDGFHLYKRTYPAGKVELYANSPSNNVPRSPYFVIIL